MRKLNEGQMDVMQSMAMDLIEYLVPGSYPEADGDRYRQEGVLERDLMVLRNTMENANLIDNERYGEYLLCQDLNTDPHFRNAGFYARFVPWAGGVFEINQVWPDGRMTSVMRSK